jgi:hypothetical protein
MQEAIVALIVLVAAAYAAWSLMPGAWRGALRRRFAPHSVPADNGRACSACNDCGACGPSSQSARSMPAPGPRPADGVQPLRFVRPERRPSADRPPR